MKLIALLLTSIFSGAIASGQEPKMRLNIINNQLNEYSLVKKGNNSIKLTKQKKKGSLLSYIHNNNLIAVETDHSYIYIYKGNDLNFDEFVSFFGVMSINEIPRESGTFLISIGSDSNNPLYCHIDEKETDSKLIQEWGKCIMEKKLSIQKNTNEEINENYSLHVCQPNKEIECLGLEITPVGILQNKISDVIITPKELERYMNNPNLERPDEVKKILSLIFY